MFLTAYLDRSGTSDAEFARRIGVTPQALSRYKLGHRRPAWSVLERIKAETQGAVTADDFMLGAPPSPSTPTSMDPSPIAEAGA